MTISWLAIFALVLEMHAWAERNEPELDWQVRADAIAWGITAEAKDVDEASALLAIVKKESRGSKASYAGKRYRSPFQLARCNAADEGEWAIFAGQDQESVQYSANKAVGIYRKALKSCKKGSIPCAMSRYAGSKHHISRKGRDRARIAANYRLELLKLTRQEGIV